MELDPYSSLLSNRFRFGFPALEGNGRAISPFQGSILFISIIVDKILFLGSIP